MSAADIEIRRLGEGDAETFRDIRLEALARNPETFGSTFDAEKEKPLSWFSDRLGAPHVHGAFHAAKLIGIAALVIQQSAKMAHKGALVGMYVQPQARRLGVGRRLVEAIIDTARRHVELVQLTVVTGNEAALRLYTGLGFVQYGLEKKALKQGGCYYDEILMAKDLTQDQN